MRTLGVVTVARSDYGIYLPVLRKIQADPELRLHLIVSGMHLAPEFGRTVEAIEADGFEIAERVEMLVASDTPEAVAKSMGLGLIGFAQTYARLHLDILLVLGDRFEMHAAALAALPFKIPVAHIHGGELTEGAIDDALRHSMTKLSHLHFVSTDEHARRVVQLGEEPWRVTVSGAPSLDNLQEVKLLSVAELEAKFGLRLNQPPLLVTYHPVTLEHEQTEQQVKELLAALNSFEAPIVLTAPNADTGGRIVTRMIGEYVDAHASAQLVDNLGTQAYFSLMAIASAMVGNSSSGIIEASTFKLPVVNIGNRQKGRVRGENVIDVGYRREEIIEGIEKALRPDFRASLSQMINPYGSGAASEKIVARLKEVPLDDHLLVKRFHDIKLEPSTERGAAI
jgi:UDP-hydrolysing UDP-N-acetyl-D-glucosamine 2-epimerase